MCSRREGVENLEPGPGLLAISVPQTALGACESMVDLNMVEPVFHIV